MTAATVPRSARIVLLLGVLSGLGTLVVMLQVKPDQLALASDVYLHAARAALAGGDVYAVTPPDHPGYYYLYPPIVIVAFLPHALLGSEAAAFALQTAVNVAAGAGIAVVLHRALVRRGVASTRLDLALFAAFALVSAHGVVPLLNGQVTLPLAFAFAVGFDALDRRRDALAGVAFGLAALVKVFPAVVGLWLLRRRATRSVVAAVGVGTGGLALGALVFGPDLTVTYLTEVLLGRYEVSTIATPPDPYRNVGGVRRQLAALLRVEPPLRTLLALVVLAPFLAVLYRRIDTDERRQAAALGTVVATLLFFPLQPLYFPLIAFPLVVLLYVLPPGPPRAVLIAGTLFTYVTGGLESSELAVELLPLPAGLEAGALRLVEAAVTVALPQTIGLWLLLVACVLVQYGGGGSSPGETSPGETSSG